MANKFIHYTCDTIDILDETLDGKKSFHATKMIAWQRGQTDVALEVLQPSTTHILVVPTVLEDLHLDRTTPKTSEQVFTITVDEAWSRKSEEGNELIKRMEAADLAFFLYR